MKTTVPHLIYRKAKEIVIKFVLKKIELTVRDLNNCKKVIWHYNNKELIDFHYIKAIEDFSI